MELNLSRVQVKPPKIVKEITASEPAGTPEPLEDVPCEEEEEDASEDEGEVVNSSVHETPEKDVVEMLNESNTTDVGC